ncbi:Formamidopyrimidine-DNA glycosylase [Sinobacterium norvegicum]|uniref:Formamidopyrimidine-DNA glycosylase n=1 Tax=Sinobacterium norvegicum TaxID=1641715 RepID=A0ABM9AI99_9GAMM|nr:bifunctional DNA-formamidopyrimidine glycosylase/DNA-(apurinic or apyrimidinic site) lyase [Sinobacterium norvegicum]CAH0992958.1 Formamidopyrimidine-DNA glycosylase [Sinobacterium norvegicum]
MPELPEVETTLRGIEPHIQRQRITEVIIRQPQLRWPIPSNLDQLLAGKKVLSCQRRAKYLLLNIGNGFVIIHLGMSGSLRIIPSETPAEKHDHVDIVFDNNKTLRYHDPRRFGAVLWVEPPFEQHKLFSQLGPEPLTDDFDGKRLFTLSRQKKTPAKTFIMDNKTVVGVGNIYANEALFMAGIHPRRAAGKISLQRYIKLAGAIKQVLRKAIAEGGTTLKDFVGGDGKPGYFQQQLNVYGRSSLPCVKCDRPLKEIKISARSTVFCSNCQR